METKSGLKCQEELLGNGLYSEQFTAVEAHVTAQALDGT